MVVHEHLAALREARAARARSATSPRATTRAVCTTPFVVERADEADLAAAGEPDRGAHRRAAAGERDAEAAWATGWAACAEDNR